MKKLAIVSFLSLFLVACSSGSSVSSVPPTITGLYQGPFQSSNGRVTGVFIMNLAEDDSGIIEGTIQTRFDGTDEVECTDTNSIISGTVNGFNVRLETATITISETTTTNEDGEPTTSSTTTTGTITFQLTSEDNTLFGTYVSSGLGCSFWSGTGNITLSR